ncbi:hypothetical protein DMJ13_20060 [halophilic archaeon]|nr:hypothetical protein DMJ13_20060 [halophilic archaeon]
MASASVELSEPEVLGHAKRRLFPDDDEPNTYAVVDTQFSTDQWLVDEEIESALRETLAPFNHVRLGSGYPDLVGVRMLESNLLAVDEFGDEPPLIVIESKGYTNSNTVDTEQGIVQAYDRLQEANAAYLAAPVSVVSRTDRTLARELNVGILGVYSDGQVEPLEIPRVVGNRATDDASAIRFQASAQGVANKSFGLNHPKNYLGYPLAHYAAGPTDDLLSEYKIVSAVDDARRGAAFLGLINEDVDGVSLTPLGREVIRFAKRRCGSVQAALEEFESWYRKSRRFSDLAPEWGQLARRVVYAYPATQLLVEEIQRMYDQQMPDPTLVDVVEHLHDRHPTFAIELFIRGDKAVQQRVLTTDGDLRRPALADGNVYHSPTVFQLKAMLYHTGILTERGREPNKLTPTKDIWALLNPV